jgi:AcrR family transcriptional regulator
LTTASTAKKVPTSIPRRERNRQQKLQRIRDAAAGLFKERGFTKATTQEIAERADISAGTLFTYARTKEELVVMVMADGLRATLRRACSTLPDGSLVDQAAYVFGRLLRYHASEMELSIYFVRETAAVPDPKLSSEVDRLVGEIVDAIEGIIGGKQHPDRIRSDVAAREIAFQFFHLYYGTLCALLRDETLARAQRLLKSRFRVLFEGIGA